MKTPAEVRFGELLVTEGLITEPQLEAALADQRSRQDRIPLGRILVERKLVTQRQLTLLLDRHDKRPRLGEVLLRNGSLTDGQLEHGLQQQRVNRRPLGEVLVNLGFVNDETMRQALSLQLSIPYLDLDRFELDRALARIINRSYARRHSLVPVTHLGQMLTVSMDDPTNTAVVEDLSRSTGYIVNVVTSSGDSIKRAFKRLYDETAEAEYLAAGIDSIDVGGDSSKALGTLTKSKYVEEYIQDKKADAALRQLMAIGIERRCSDIHLEMLSGRMHVRFRIDGVLQELELGPLQEVCDQHAREVISRIKILGKLDIAERRRPQDGAFRVRVDRSGEGTQVDFRVSILPGYYGESAVLRILDKKNAPKSIEQLGLSPAVEQRLRQLLQRPSGILLITGPTGSGKSSTLYAALMTIHRPGIRILTAEDPIEYVYEQFSQSEVNDRIGNTFGRYLRAFLRHDPEVIMIGEIRDEDTAEMAFRAAQTGHLLLSTLHTNDAISAVTRLIDMHVDPNLLASSLIGVLSQRLIRRLCPDCSQEYEPPPELVREFFAERPAGLTFYRGIGCQECNFTGYRGRMGITELWVPDEEDVILISKGAPVDAIRASARRTTISMAQDAFDRLKAGRANLEELIRMLPYSSVYQFRQLITTPE